MGKLKWYFQFTPNDAHDWDSTQIPVLIDGELRGQPRKLLAWPNRNGFFYLLDRTNGQFQFAKAFARQTWNQGFDDKGRPVVIPGNEPTPEGNDKIQPSDDGAANWMARSYNPVTTLLYVAAREKRHLFTKEAIRHLNPDGSRPPRGRPDAGGHVAGTRPERPPRFAPEESWGKVIAIDPLTGAIRWEDKLVTPPWGGVTSTAGNLLFGGTLEGVIYALDARTGQRLWYFAGNDRVYASPVTYLANGKEYMSLAVGDVIAT
jgi:glucose dehydrogenase